MRRQCSWSRSVWEPAIETADNVGSGDEASLQSVLVELEFAILFCAMDKPWKDELKVAHNIENALRANSEGVRFLFNTSLPRAARDEVIDKLALLHAKIRDMDKVKIALPRIPVPSTHPLRG